MFSQEGSRHKFPKFNEFTNMKKKINMKLGMKFTNHNVFKDALKHYAIENGIDFAYVRNESQIITVHCKRNCSWRIHASQTREEKCFQIKTWYNVDHNDCGRSNHNTKANARWLAKKY